MDIGYIILFMVLFAMMFALAVISVCKGIARVKEAFYHERIYKRKIELLSNYRHVGEESEYQKRIQTETELKSVLAKLDEINAKLDKAETIIRNQERMIDAFKKAYDNTAKRKAKTEK